MKKFLILLILMFPATICLCAQEVNIQQKQDEAFQLIFSDQTKALVLIDSLISKENDFNATQRGRHYSLKGVYFGVQNNLDSATVYFAKALELVPKKDVFYPKLINNLAITYKKKGDYQGALNLLLEAQEIAITSNNKEALQKIYSEMSSTYRALNNYNLAVEYSLKAIDIENKKEVPNPKNLAFEKQKTANLYGLLENYAFAEKIFEEIIDYFEVSPYKDANISTYLNYANALIKLNKKREAQRYIEKAKQVFGEFENEELYAFLKLTEANYFASIGEKEKAKKCFEKSIASFGQHQDNYLKTLNQYLHFLIQNSWFEDAIQLSVIENDKDLDKFGIVDYMEYKNYMASAYESLAQYDKSSKYYKASLRLKDSLQAQKNFQIAKDLQAKYQNEIIQQKNLNLQEKIQSEGRKNLAILGFSLFIGALLLGFLLRIRIKLKNKTLLNEAFANKIEAEEKLLAFKDALLEEQKKELLSKSLETAALSEKLKSIQAKLGKNETSISKKLIDFQQFLTPENELKKLSYEFQRVYPDFENHLIENYPELNKNDLLFLSFIKLKFSFKDISTILNITHQSVITKKYRISKKLGLSKDEDIYEFISSV